MSGETSSDDLQRQRRNRLDCRNRPALAISEFQPEDRLYFSFDQSLVDDEATVKTEALRLPDFSCNWSRFSLPEDVRFRRGGRITDGCAAIQVEDVRYEGFANAVHDPICDEEPQNYSHVEVRQVPPGGDLQSEPPRRFKKGSKAKRNAWRRHIRNRLTILLHPTA
ncbi:MAG: hypothetical protein WD045_04895 [Pirellulaceae bacterium]